MRKIVDVFYKERSIVNHQIASYNDFLERRLQSIVDSTIIGQEEDPERGYIYPEIEGYKIKFGKIRVGTPKVKEADGTVRDLTPMEARLRDLTYEAPITLEFIPVDLEGAAPLVVRDVYRAIGKLKSKGLTILLVEQNARVALTVADRGYVLETGQIVLEGTSQQLCNNPEVQRAYLGKEYQRIDE